MSDTTYLGMPLEFWTAGPFGIPFHLWSVFVGLVGLIVGSFLNVVIHRMPLDQSVVSPPSLAQTSLATAAPAAAKQPVASDVTLDMRFMVLPTSSDAERRASFVAATESAKASDLVLPCLDVRVMWG